MKLRSILIFVAIVLILPIALLLIEDLMRHNVAETIPVSNPNNVNATVNAVVRPDWLFVGQDWYIRTSSNTPFKLIVNDKHTLNIPTGQQHIYSNHDTQNASQYSANGEFPLVIKSISIQP